MGTTYSESRAGIMVSVNNHAVAINGWIQTIYFFIHEQDRGKMDSI